MTYGVRVLDALRELGVESHLVVTRAALLTLSQETDLSADDLLGRADVTHRLNDVGASIASGSFRTMGMIIAPCSVRTMGEIATGVTSTLLTRAAVARAIGAPRRLSEDELDAFLDRVSRTTGAHATYSALADQARTAKTPGDLMRVAAALYRWNQELTRARQ